MKKSEAQYVICVKNRNHRASLELRKIYRRLSDTTATRHGLVRIIDESGEDYLYPADYFIAIHLPQAVEKAIVLAS